MNHQPITQTPDQILADVRRTGHVTLDGPKGSVCVTLVTGSAEPGVVRQYHVGTLAQNVVSGKRSKIVYFLSHLIASANG